MRKLTLPEQAQIAMARALVAMPVWLRERILGAPVVKDGHTLDRQFQLVLSLDARLRRARAARGRSLPRMRREIELRASVFAPRPPALAAVESIRLRGAAGEIAARLYRPRPDTSAQPALVYYHGGGWVVGSLDSHDPVCRALAVGASCVVISVDYRLAPEHRFPAAVEDAEDAFRAVCQDAARLGIDPARVAVGGDSAGGNLAAVVAQRTRQGGPRPCFQLLVYPAVDMTMSMPSIQSLGQGYALEREEMEWYRAQYLTLGMDLRDPRASPLHAEDLSGLPPAFVMTAGFDPLRDEGDAYADRLRAAGVAVQHVCYGPLVHGFLNTTGAIDGARGALGDAVEALRAALV
jgi:acetyl esterase